MNYQKELAKMLIKGRSTGVNSGQYNSEKAYSLWDKISEAWELDGEGMDEHDRLNTAEIIVEEETTQETANLILKKTWSKLY